jgi:pyruvate dehydrogenase E2 component (dihydrolipoamide acetyltransferase)
MSAALTAVTVPKWGLAMEEGRVTAWYVAEGDSVVAGQELVDVETAKIANTVESPADGRVGRIVAPADRTVPVGGLLAVLCGTDVNDADIDAFVAGFAIETAAEVAGPAEPEYIDAGGQRIRILKTGEASGAHLPLFLLHGFYSDLDTWMFLRDRLPADRMIVALDLPGHGSSTKDAGAATPEALGQAVLSVMDAIGVARAHLIGHSMGGAVALSLAAAHADRVASVVCIASPGFGEAVSREFVQGMLESRRARDFRPFAAMLFADPSLVTKDLLEDLAKVKRVDGVQAALEAIADATLFAPETQRLAAASPRPVLAIIGERDVVVPPPSALPAGVHSLRLPVGHMAHMEAPAEVARAIGGFLDAQEY